MHPAPCSQLTSGNFYLRRLDGRIKTIVLLAAIITVSVLTRWSLAAGVLSAALALICTLRLPPGRLLRRMSIPFGVAWLVLASLVFSTGHTAVATVSFRHISLTVYREGMALGFLVMLRILAAVSLASLLSFSTPMIEVLATLRLLKVPGLILDLADMIYRYSFSLREIAVTMRKAQCLRGGEELPWHRQARDIGMLSGNLLAKAFARGESVYKAMLARGYDEDAKTASYYTSAIPPRDLLAGVLAGLILIALLVCNFTVGWKGW